MMKSLHIAAGKYSVSFLIFATLFTCKSRQDYSAFLQSDEQSVVEKIRKCIKPQTIAAEDNLGVGDISSRFIRFRYTKNAAMYPTEPADEEILLGVRCYDESVLYLSSGMDKLYAIMFNILHDEPQGNFFERLYADSQDRDLSWAIGRNSLPIELIPTPLRDLGVTFDYFIVPHEGLTPSQIRQTYAKSESLRLGYHSDLPKEQRDAALKELYQTSLLFSLDPLMFEKFVTWYETLYFQGVFKMIRQRVASDRLMAEGSKELTIGVSLIASGLTSFVGARYATMTFWQRQKSAEHWVKSLAWTLGGMVTAQVVERKLKGTQKFREAREWYAALGGYGFRGREFHQKNIEFLERIEESKITPSLAEFLQIDAVKYHLTAPFNMYSLTSFEKLFESVQTNLELRQILENGEKCQRGCVENLLKTEIERNRIKTNDYLSLREALIAGWPSALFRELFVLSLAKGPVDFQFVAMIQRGNARGYYDGLEQRFELIAGTSHTYQALVLAHELWHRNKSMFIFNDQSQFPTKRMFFEAAAADELVATATSVIVKSELTFNEVSDFSARFSALFANMYNFDAKGFMWKYLPEKFLSYAEYRAAMVHYSQFLDEWNSTLSKELFDQSSRAHISP